MKLALVMKDYDILRGGAERYLVGLVPRVAESGISVDLIASRFKTNLPPGVSARTVKTITWSSILKPLSFNISAQRLLKQSNYDLVYGLTQIYPQDVYRVGGGLEHSWLRIRYPKKWLRIINSIRPRLALRLYIENRIFKKGNYKKIIANSFYCKHQILERYKVSPEDIVVVYNGVDRERFSPEVKSLYRAKVRNELNIPSSHKVVVFVSNNWARKGLKELIKAFAKLGQSRPVWLVAVGKSNKRVYERLGRRLGVSKKIIFVNYTKEPWRYYGAADLFVLPTYYDPFANVVLEALACGVPVVTTRTNGARELIIEGKNGYLVDTPQDITQIAEYIEEILFKSNPDQAEREAVASVGGFTIERNVSKTLEVFKDVMKKKEDSSCSDNAILINNGYRRFFEEKGWGDFRNVMSISGGELYKKNRFRSVVKVCSNGRRLFLKRHFNPHPRCPSGGGVSWAMREWQNMYRLKALGISTMNPVAVGEGSKGEGSFLFTESLDSAERLEDFVPEYFPDLLGSQRFLEKVQLIGELAQLTRRLHRENLFHKDFYAGHIFVEKKGDSFKLYLIDLQRLCAHHLFRSRWRIKDLASLNFSCSHPLITNADRLRFLKCYLGVKAFNKIDRDFIYRIVSKTKKIARHTHKKYLGKLDQL